MSAPQPPAPSGVRVQVKGRRKAPDLDVVYRGETDDGMHEWVAAITQAQLDQLRTGHASLSIDVMPGRTDLVLEVPEPNGDDR